MGPSNLDIVVYNDLFSQLTVIPLCRSYCSLLSLPKPSLLQDSVSCVLEFVRVCVPVPFLL